MSSQANKQSLSASFEQADTLWTQLGKLHFSLQQLRPKHQHTQSISEAQPNVLGAAIAYFFFVAIEALLGAPPAFVWVEDVLPISQKDTPTLYYITLTFLALGIATIFTVLLGLATEYFQQADPIHAALNQEERGLNPMDGHRQQKAIRRRGYLAIILLLVFTIALAANRAYVYNEQQFDLLSLVSSILAGLFFLAAAWVTHPRWQLFWQKTRYERRYRRMEAIFFSKVAVFKSMARFLIGQRPQYSLLQRADVDDPTALVEQRYDALLQDELAYSGLIPKHRQRFVIKAGGEKVEGVPIGLITVENSTYQLLTDQEGECQFELSTHYPFLAEVIIAGRSETNFYLTDAPFALDLRSSIDPKYPNDENKQLPN